MSKSSIKIKGEVVYQHLGPGFWGIIGDDGREWRPLRMPEQLKYEGKTVELTAEPVEEEVSVFMWGSPIRITSFQTMAP